jgi:hypothetical protein
VSLHIGSNIRLFGGDSVNGWQGETQVYTKPLNRTTHEVSIRDGSIA